MVSNWKVQNYVSVLVRLIIISLILCIVTYTIFSFVESRISAAKKEELESKIDQNLNVETQLLAKEFDIVTSDLYYLYENYKDLLYMESKFDTIENA